MDLNTWIFKTYLCERWLWRAWNLPSLLHFPTKRLLPCFVYSTQSLVNVMTITVMSPITLIHRNFDSQAVYFKVQCFVLFELQLKILTTRMNCGTISTDIWFKSYVWSSVFHQTTSLGIVLTIFYGLGGKFLNQF